jgi:hypothetical protein
MLKPTLMLMMILIAPFAHTEPVNVNLATADEISSSLNLSRKAGDSISMHCQYLTCRRPEDLLQAPGINTDILNRIRNELIFTLMERGTGYSDDC